MALGVPSIQSFFKKEVPSIKHHKPAKSVDLGTGDGFTSSEIDAALHPALHKWQPRCEYKKIDINGLVPGPGCVNVQGRIVNLYNQPFSSKMPHAARGCLNLIVKDDTGAFRVKRPYRLVKKFTERQSVGQTSLRQNRLWLASWPPRLHLDPTHLECRFHLPHRSRGFTHYFHLSRKGQLLLPHGSGG